MRLARVKKKCCKTEQEIDYITIEGTEYNYRYHFPSVFINDPRNNMPIVKEILTELTFRSNADIGGVYYEGKCHCVHHYKKMMTMAQYQTAYGLQNAQTLMETIKVNKHIAFTLGLIVSGEQGWQAMINDNGNNPTAASMAINAALKNADRDNYNLTANNNRHIDKVFPQHGLAHGTNYGLSVIGVYGHQIPRSIAQLDFYDYAMIWRKRYTPYPIGNNDPIPQASQDPLAIRLSGRFNSGNPTYGEIYKHSFITTYLVHHRLYGGFGSPNQCINSMLRLSSHPILAIHALYRLALEQDQLCTHYIWLVLPFKPLFIIMIQIWQRKTGKPIQEAPSSYKDLLTVEENNKIFKNVFEKEYILKFPKGSIKEGHNCTVLARCGSKKFSEMHFEQTLQNAYALARSHVCKYPMSNGVIGNIFAYALNKVIKGQQEILTRPEYQKYFAYVDPTRHNEIVAKINEIITASNDNIYIDDFINTEMYYLIEKLPDPQDYPDCINM